MDSAVALCVTVSPTFLTSTASQGQNPSTTDHHLTMHQQLHQQQDKSNPTVRRSLFQRANGHVEQEHEVIQAEQIDKARLDNSLNVEVELLAGNRDEMKRKWNFDFETETPLDGQWEWEAVVQVVRINQQQTGGRDGRIDSDIKCDNKSDDNNK